MRARVLVPELMDDPALPRGDHLLALRGLARLNRLSAAAPQMWRTIRPLARVLASTNGSVQMLDVATGSGDVPLRLALLARSDANPVRLDPTLCDSSPTALEAAMERAERLGVSGVSTRVADVVADGLPFPDAFFPVVTCSLFLHHLERHACVALLREMARVVKPRGVLVVSDLRRCTAGLVAAATAGHLLTRSRIVHVDAVRSVRAAWTPVELASIAAEAGLSDPQRLRIARVWPWRMLLRWEAP